MKTSHFFTSLFSRDYKHYDGVRPMNVYLLRLVFFLTFFFVGKSSWTAILTHEGEWKALEAVAWSVWAAYSALSFLGVLKPLKMLPIVAFQILYKIIWLAIVAYPLWINDELIGSRYEEMTNSFLWVALPVVAMPWGYFCGTFFAKRRYRQETVTEVQ